MLCRFKAYEKCGGDLVQDSDEWRCFQCRQVYYRQRTAVEPLLDPMDVYYTPATEVAASEENPDR